MVNTKIIAKDKSTGNGTIARGGSSSSNSKTGTFVNLNANLADINEIHVNDLDATNIDAEFINGTQAKIDALTGIQANIENGQFTELNTTNLFATYGQIENIKASEIAAELANLDKIKSNEIVTDNLTVLQSAHFFELIIDKIKSVGGAVILSPADGFDLYAYIDGQNDVQLFWRADQDDKSRYNMWVVNDQALCQNFNKVEVGQNYNIDSKFCWALVTATSGTQRVNVIKQNGTVTVVSDADAANTHPIWRKEDFQSINGSMYKHNSTDVIITPEQYEALTDQEKANYALYGQVYYRVDADGTIDYIAKTVYDGQQTISGYYIRTYNQIDVVKCHWIKISKTDKATNSSFVFDEGDSFVQLGNRTDTTRQSAIYLSAYDSLDTGLHAPLIAQYTGINDYNLGSHRRSYFDRTSAEFYGTFFVQASGQDLNLGNEVAELRVDVDNITTTVSSVDIGTDNVLRRTSNASKDWIFGVQGEDKSELWKLYFNNLDNTNYADYVVDEVFDETNAPDIKSGIMFYRLNTQTMPSFNFDVDGSSQFMSFYQNLYRQDNSTYTCRLKPNTWYTISFLTRGWNTNENRRTKIYTFITNCKQGEYVDDVIVDGTKQTNTSPSNKQAWEIGWTIEKHSYTFKTGSLMGENDELPQFIIRPVENSLLSFGQIQLEEGNRPSAWHESIYDINYTFSKIEQRADGIELSVTDINDGLTTTGINISNHTITLNAENTIINGNLNLSNPEDGFIMYDSNDSPNIILLNDSIAMNGQKNTYNLTNSGTVDNLFIDNTYTQALGRFIKGSKLRIDNFNQWYQIGTIPSTAFISGSSKADVTGVVKIKNSLGQVVATSNSIVYQTNVTQPSAEGLIPFFSTDYVEMTIPENDTYTVEEEISCMLLSSTTGTCTTYHAATYYVNKNSLQVIGTDGFSFRTNTNTVLYGNANEIAMQNGLYNTIKVIDNNAVRSSLEYHGTVQQPTSIFGDISTTPPFREINASSTGYVLTQYDGVITISNADIMLPADNSNIPVGKVWYIIALTIATSGGACHVQKNGNTLEGLGSNQLLASRYKVYTLIYVGSNLYVIS